MTRSFGTKIDTQFYRERLGAYAVPIDSNGRIALVETPSVIEKGLGLFLIGGGIEPGESPEECIRRECLEETGHIVEVGELLCTGDEYLFAPSDRRYLHVIGCCYRAVLGDKIQVPVEKDHTLKWVPVEESLDKMFLKYQAWAVKMAWENEKKEK